MLPLDNSSLAAAGCAVMLSSSASVVVMMTSEEAALDAESDTHSTGSEKLRSSWKRGEALVGGCESVIDVKSGEIESSIS